MRGMDVPVLIAFIVVLVGLWLWWPRPTLRRCQLVVAIMACSLLLVACVSVGPFSHQQVSGTKEAVVFDVGQGDAMLVRDGDKTALIDTGPSEKRLREQLAEQGVRHIDTLILTHDHADHARGAQALDPSYGIKQIVVTEGAQSSSVYQNIAERCNAALVGALAGTAIKLNKLELRIIGPATAVSDPSANASCLIILIVDTTAPAEDANPEDIILNSGDAEAPEVHKALDNPKAQTALITKGRIANVDVLKVPHHGSKKSVDERLLTRLKARIALISAGEGNQYGHPRPEPLALLRKHLLTIFRTDLDGSVRVPL